MQSPEAVAAKRKVLVDALTICLERSKVKEIVPLETIRSLLSSASGELWREGEFRLEIVWKVLCQQPGLSAHEVAPPLLVFKSFESELGVTVRVPQALSAIPRGEQVKLREQVQITKEDFVAAVQKLTADSAREMKDAPPPPKADMAKAAQQAAEATAPVRRVKTEATRQQKLLASALAALALTAVVASLFISLKNPSTSTELGDVSSVLQLSDGHRGEQTLSARIADPRWETMGPDEQKRVATQLFEKLTARGIKVLTLTDGSGRVRVNVSNATGSLVVTVH
jgi:hypothetical protein